MCDSVVVVIISGLLR